MADQQKTPTAIQAKPAELVRLDPQSLIHQAIVEKADVETMERLVALAKDIRAEQARDAYNKAMAEFQERCPSIFKDDEADAGRYRYTYATLGNILKTIKPIMGPLGLSISWRQRFEAKSIVVNCRISHHAGHFEESGELPVPIDDSSPDKGATPAQRIGIAQSYGRRYTLLAAAGLSPEDDEDLDGAARPTKTVAQPQRKSEKAKAAAPANLPASSPWTGELHDIKVQVGYWELHAEQSSVVFYTDQTDIKDKAADAMSNGHEVSIEWKKSPKGTAYVETLTAIMD